MPLATKLPTMLGTDAMGQPVDLKNYTAKGFIVYFYPKDNTPGCSLEAQSFAANYQLLQNMGWQVIGVSKDSAASHTRFADKYCLPFPLVADVDTTLCQAAGVWQLKKMAGKEYMGIVRTTFLTDTEGNVLDVITKVNTREAAQQVISAIQNLNV